MVENKLSSISNASTLEEIGAFWDEHDFTEFDTDAPNIEFNVSCDVSIEPDLLSALEEHAGLRHIGVETLVNLWLREKLAEQFYAIPA